MTKFEEEFKALTSWDWINIDLIQQILTRFGNWHSDGEFQELLSKYSGLNDNYEKEVIKNSKLESQIANLKSQLQQQALPVVPECVAEWYEGCAPIPVETCITDFLFNYQKEKSVDDGTEFEQWFIRTDNSIEILMDMKRLGYQVEKPQLFYIEFPKVSKRDSYPWVVEIEDGIIIDFTDKKSTALKLTEQEIKSIDERYWRFAVPVEDGE